MKRIGGVLILAAGLVALLMTAITSSGIVSAAPDANNLSVQAIYQNGSSSVEVGEIFTQRVRFERTDASGNLQLGISVPLTQALKFAGRPSIDKSGSVQTTKINVTDSAFNWRGGVSGNGFIEIDIPMWVDPACEYENSALCSSELLAQVVNNTGEVMLSQTAPVSVTGDSNFKTADVKIETGSFVVANGGGLGFNTGKKLDCAFVCAPAAVSMTNDNAVPARVVLFGVAPDGMRWSEQSIFSDMDFTDGRQAEMEEGKTRTFSTFIDPGETVVLPLNLAVVEDVADDQTFSLTMRACVERASVAGCPREGARSDLDALTFHSRRRDFGDAPDSSNHAAASMLAYAGVPANFPTTADTSLPAPHGPYHAKPWPLHLGRQVSFEAGADIGPDADGLNNLEPAFAVPQSDLDQGDDGVRLDLVDFEACKMTEIPVRVAILPRAVSYFQENPGNAYLNIWIDGNHDGDWADAMMCDGNESPEHMVIDHAVDVAALGAGMHTISVTTSAVPWMSSAELPDEAWMRVTLANEKSPKMTGLTYGDGRGLGAAYLMGETEDHIYYPKGSSGDQPNIEITIEEVDRGDERREEFSGRAPEMLRRPNRELIIRFRNVGFKPAADLQIDVELANALDQIIYDSWKGCLTCVRSSEFYQSQDTVIRGPDNAEIVFPRFKTFNIGTLQPQEFGTIVLGWTGCLTCTRDIDAVSFHQIKAKSGSLEWIKKFQRSEEVLVQPFIRTAWTGCLTCTRQVEDIAAVQGWDEGVAAVVGTPGSALKILLNGKPTGQTAMIGPDGYSEIVLQYPTGPTDPGVPSVFQVVAQQGGKESRPSNALDLSCPPSGVHILTIGQVDKAGEVTFMPRLKPTSDNPAIRYLAAEKGDGVTLAGFGTFLAYRPCRSQQTELSLNYLGTDVVFDKQEQFGDVTVLGWTGCLTCTRSVENSQVTISAEVTPAGFADPIEYDYVLEYGTPGHFTVNDASTGQPLSDVEITVLRKVKKGTGRHTWVDVGHCVTTLKDGSWSALVPAGEYMVIAKKDGYQPYRSDSIFIVLTSTDELFDSKVGRAELGFNIGMPPTVSSEKQPEVVDISNGNLGNVFVHISANTPVKFVNRGGADTSLTTQIDGRGPNATNIDSGLLASGESFEVLFDEPGTYTYQVAGDENQQGVIVVSGSSSSGNKIYLPLIIR